jgi:hypothetical protein
MSQKDMLMDISKNVSHVWKLKEKIKVTTRDLREIRNT